MIYLEYERYKERLLEAQKFFNDILLEAEELFAITQVKSTKYGRDRVQTSTKRNNFDAYLCAKEAHCIDSRLKEAKKLLEERKYILQEKEKELRQSKDTHDLVYLYKFVDHMRADHIARKLNYSESQIYRIAAKLKEAIQCERGGVIIET